MLNDSQAMLEVSSQERLTDHVSHSDWSLWNKSSIASLTAIQISRMDHQTLEEVVEFVQHELPQTLVRERLQVCDRSTLEQLAYLTRRICRNQGY